MAEQDLRQVRLDKLQNFKKKGETLYPYSYPRTHNLREAINLPLKTKDVFLSGRMMTYRDMGKLAFATLSDHSGKMQIAFQVDVIGKDSFKFFSKNFDIGDIIGVSGEIFKTHKGEITLLVKEYKLLAKGLLPLPEKWHGISDKELRYRKRYLDFMFNQDVISTFKKRAKILKGIRRFLDDKGATEFENPVLESIYGGANAEPFHTHLNALDLPMYLRISLELPLKRLLVGGFDFVYEMGRVFRNEGVDRSHNPEFTLLEWYKAYASYEDTMDLTEELFEYLAKEVLGTTEINYQGQKISLKAPFERLSMTEVLKKYGKLDVEKMSVEDLLNKVDELNLNIIEAHKTKGWVIMELFDKLCEDKLIQPVFITNHPVETTPFCKVDPKNPETLERFELYINGWEMANAYSELNDPVLQRKYLEQQSKDINKGDKEAHQMNEDYIEALEYGLPPNSGIGFGIDRLVMLLTDSVSIRDVLVSPMMKPDQQTMKIKNVISDSIGDPDDKVENENVIHNLIGDPDDKTQSKKMTAGITLEEAKKLVKDNCDFSLQRHNFTVSASMKALAKHFKDEDNSEFWEIAGLIHDIDWNSTIDKPEEHCGEETQAMLKENKCSDELIKVSMSHYGETNIARDSKIKKALAASDELTGFIVACCLVRPNKMADIKPKSVTKKLKDKSFAAQVNRQDMKLCEEYFDIPVSEFIGILIPAIQEIAGEWELR